MTKRKENRGITSKPFGRAAKAPVLMPGKSPEKVLLAQMAKGNAGFDPLWPSDQYPQAIDKGEMG